MGSYLENASQKFTETLQKTIKTAQYNKIHYSNGSKAKEALIRSQTLIQNFHEALKELIKNEIEKDNTLSTNIWEIYPDIGKTFPELKIFGALKGKKQDITFTRHPHQPESVLSNQKDSIGYEASNTAIICGVRSQMSSIEKNFDTLMERAIAEAVNLNKRLPNTTLVELYIIPLQEIDNKSAEKNIFSTLDNQINIEKFIEQFYLTTAQKDKDIYMMDACCLLILDLNNPGKIIYDSEQLKKEINCNPDILQKFKLLQPKGFGNRILKRYKVNNNLE